MAKRGAMPPMPKKAAPRAAPKGKPPMAMQMDDLGMGPMTSMPRTARPMAGAAGIPPRVPPRMATGMMPAAGPPPQPMKKAAKPPIKKR